MWCALYSQLSSQNWEHSKLCKMTSDNATSPAESGRVGPLSLPHITLSGSLAQIPELLRPSWGTVGCSVVIQRGTCSHLPVFIFLSPLTIAAAQHLFPHLQFPYFTDLAPCCSVCCLSLQLFKELLNFQYPGKRWLWKWEGCLIKSYLTSDTIVGHFLESLSFPPSPRGAGTTAVKKLCCTWLSLGCSVIRVATLPWYPTCNVKLCLQWLIFISEIIFRMQATLDELTSLFGSSPPAKTSHTSQKSKKAKELCKRSRDQMIIVRFPLGCAGSSGWRGGEETRNMSWV